MKVEKFVQELLDEVMEQFPNAIEINKWDKNNLELDQILSLSVLLTLDIITKNPTEFLIFAKNTLLEYQKEFPLTKTMKGDNDE